MSEKIEGTLRLEGLVEGHLPDEAETETRLREWVRFAAGMRLRFALEVDGNRFSLLADNTPVSAKAVGAVPSETIAEALTELLKVFPERSGSEVLSTVRSVEYRKGEEVQTLYSFTADRSVDTHQRTLKARTKAPPQPLTLKERLRLAAFGLGIALVVFAASAVFVDYGKLLRNIIEDVRPYDAAQLDVDVETFAGYFALQKKTVDRSEGLLVLTLKRSKSYPKTDADLDRLLADAQPSHRRRLALDAIARGYVRCECFDREHRFIGFVEKRIGSLREKETVEVSVPLPRKDRLKRVVLTY
ncbi:MAG: hypothetical protein AMS16_04865 [Planctomycetes bacterium DG_58]|nr:MAG: hypothetical protein AMS16_04865 [Planctomycetes bacterium DG_58]KPK96802.1 MAG: hypothetical protein AMK75_07840 [Planctomycetes bacterium SM23_65]